MRSVRAMRVKKKSSSKGQGKQRASKKERDREFLQVWLKTKKRVWKTSIRYLYKFLAE